MRIVMSLIIIAIFASAIPLSAYALTIDPSLTSLSNFKTLANPDPFTHPLQYVGPYVLDSTESKATGFSIAAIGLFCADSAEHEDGFSFCAGSYSQLIGADYWAFHIDPYFSLVTYGTIFRITLILRKSPLSEGNIKFELTPVLSSGDQCTVSGATLLPDDSWQVIQGGNTGTVMITCPSSLAYLAFDGHLNNSGEGTEQYLYSVIQSAVVTTNGTPSANLAVATPTTANSQTTADGNYSISPDPKNLQVVTVPVTGTGLTAGMAGNATVTLQVGTRAPISQTVSLASLQSAGTLQVKFPTMFTAGDAGALNLVASVSPDSSVTETNTADNTVTQKMYVLCDVQKDHGLTVSFQSQVDPAWKTKPYGPFPEVDGDTIGAFGCYLTNVSMVMNAYGITKTLDGQPLNPLNLNNAAASSYFDGALSMMDDGGGIVAQGMVNYARTSYAKICSNGATVPTASCKAAAASQISVKPDHFAYDQTYATQQICNGSPIILRLNIPASAKKAQHSHFVLATAQTVDASGNLTYLINNPAYFDPRLGVNRTLTSDFPTAANPINGMRPYVHAADPAMLMVDSSSTVEYIVTDPQGRRTGYNPLTRQTFNEIPGSSYYKEFMPNEDDSSNVPDLPTRQIFQGVSIPDGSYKVDLFGVSSGHYTVAIRGYDSAGYANGASENSGQIASGGHVTFSYTHSATAVTTGQLRITNLAVLDPNKSSGDRVLVTGKLTSPSGKIMLKDSLKIGINGYSKSIPASSFRKTKTFLGTVYSFDDRTQTGVSIVMDDTGNFVLYSRDINPGDANTSEVVQVDVQADLVYANSQVNLKCWGRLCYGK